MNLLIFLSAAITTFAMPVNPRLKGCWRGSLPGNATVEIIFSNNKNIAEGLYFERDKTRTLADFSCSKKLPATCTLFGDAGKFELSVVKKTQAQMKFQGEWILDTENPDEARVAIKSGKETSHVALTLMPDSICKERQKELRETFGVGP